MSRKKSNIQWHAAYVSSVSLELRDDRDHLIIESEHLLNKMPLQIDCLIIKNESGIVLQNEIGKLFRRHNIVEFKSPGDKLNIDTYFKVLAYASLYKSYGGSVDAIRETDISVTLIREERPKKLLKQLEQRLLCTVSCPYKGIYYITGNVIFPTQIIVTGELSRTEHIWLKSLTRNADVALWNDVINIQKSFQTQWDMDNADSVTHAILAANGNIFTRIKQGDNDMSKTAYLLFGEEMLEKDAKIEQLEQELKTQTDRISQLETIIRSFGGTIPAEQTSTGESIAN